MFHYCSLLVPIVFFKAQDGNTALEWAQKEHQDEAAKLVMKHIEEKAQLQLQSEAEEAQFLKSYMVTVDMDEDGRKYLAVESGCEILQYLEIIH